LRAAIAANIGGNTAVTQADRDAEHSRAHCGTLLLDSRRQQRAFLCILDTLAINVGAVGLAWRSPRLRHLIENDAAWGKILGNRPPLASRAQNPVYNLTDLDRRLLPPTLAFDVSPFFIGQVTRISPFASCRPRFFIVCMTILPESSDDRGTHKSSKD
jgi:hypothetical protein